MTQTSMMMTTKMMMKAHTRHISFCTKAAAEVTAVKKEGMIFQYHILLQNHTFFDSELFKHALTWAVTSTTKIDSEFSDQDGNNNKANNSPTTAGTADESYLYDEYYNNNISNSNSNNSENHYLQKTIRLADKVSTAIGEDSIHGNNSHRSSRRNITGRGSLPNSIQLSQLVVNNINKGQQPESSI